MNALPASLAGDLRGVIRNQQLRTGDYWIDCDEAGGPASQTHGRDRMIFHCHVTFGFRWWLADVIRHCGGRFRQVLGRIQAPHVE